MRGMLLGNHGQFAFGRNVEEFSALRSSLFGNNEQGLWPRPDQFGSPLTQYKESTGQNIVTAVGDTVGLAIDWRLGRTLGAELRANGVIGIVGTATAATYNTATGEGTVTRVDLSNQSFVEFSGLVPNSHYFITIQNTGAVSITARTEGHGGAFSFTVTAGTTTTGATISGPTGRITITTAGGTGTASFVLSSIKHLPGNHAYQATASKRPLLAGAPARGRVNRLIQTEAIDQAPWINSGSTVNPITTANDAVAPDGTLTAERIDFDLAGATGSSDFCWRYQNLSGVLTGQTWTFSFWAKAATPADVGKQIRAGYRYLVSSTITLTADWVRYSVTETSVGDITASFGWRLRGTEINTAVSMHVRGCQAVLGSSADNYQRVGAGIYDVTEVGQPTLYGWLSDGVDDNLETNAFDPGTDKATVCAGVRKLSDASRGTVVEFGSLSLAGTLAMEAPTSAAANVYMAHRGSTTLQGTIISSLASPISMVMSMQSNLATPLLQTRVNGVAATDQTGATGGGNFTSQKTYIGGRTGTSLFYNGYLFALCLRFAATDASLLSRLENFTAVKTLGAKL